MTDSPKTPESPSSLPELPPTRAVITWTVAALCVICTALYHMGPFIAGTPLEQIPRYLVQPPPTIWSGNWSTLFTSMFVHATAGNGIPWHLIFNMLYFVLLGRILEATLNPLNWLLFIMVSAIVSAGAELAFASQNAIGASGVVYAMFGLMWAGRYEQPVWALVATPKTFKILIAWGLFCVATTYFGWLKVANYAHAGGLLFGMSTGWLLVARRRVIPATIIMVSVIEVAALSVFWMPWSGYWNMWKGDQLVARGKYGIAVERYRISLKQGQRPAEIWARIAVAEEKLGNHKQASTAALNAFLAANSERDGASETNRIPQSQ
jgi:membrane associated rhomboid family serine protease